MRILFYLHHPAHFHLFKNIIHNLQNNHEVIVLATKKDILEDLLDTCGLDYINVLPKGRRDNKFSIAFGLVKQDFRLLRICLKRKPDILVGTSTEITHIGRLLGIPSVFVNEDDIGVIPLVGKLAYPFAHTLVVPDVCDVGKYSPKTIFYSGYHELAYLHPNHFSPDRNVVHKYFSSEKPYAILRFAKLKAHHDSGIKGLDRDIASQLIKILEPYSRIFITSERTLEPEFEPFRMNIDPVDVHHVLAFATLFIGDSQTMSAEAGVLGTPFIRFNDFVGRIGYLKDLEEKYKLGFGIKSHDVNGLYETIQMLIKEDPAKEKFKARREEMLKDKIDPVKFFTWFIANFPESKQTIQKDSQFQYRFV